eukprot:15467798-Alexandrium_andersonii.AAC.1
MHVSETALGTRFGFGVLAPLAPRSAWGQYPESEPRAEKESAAALILDWPWSFPAGRLFTESIFAGRLYAADFFLVPLFRRAAVSEVSVAAASSMPPSSGREANKDPPPHTRRAFAARAGPRWRRTAAMASVPVARARASSAPN